MELNFFTVLINVAVLVAYAIPGYILKKKNFLTKTNLSALVCVLIYVNQPLLTLSNFQSKSYDQGFLGQMGLMFVLSLLSQVLAFFLIKLILLKSKRPFSQKGVYMFASVFGNCGFMGIPILKGLFPDNPEVVLFAAVFIITFNLLAWTLGIYMLTGKREYISIKHAVFNPPTIMLALALPLFFLNIRFDDFIPSLASAIDILGSMTTPVSMIIMGARLADLKVKELVTDSMVYVVSGFKLLLFPLFVLLVLMLIPIPDMMRATLIIITAMPTGASVVAYSEKFGADSASGAKAMLMCTLLSIITIPIIAILM